MNKMVYEKMQQMPTTGRLSRLKPDPFANVSFSRVKDTVERRVKMNTKKSMKSEMQKSISLHMFNPDG